MKNFVKAMNKEGAGFCYLRQMFLRISDANIKEGIFVGPQIRCILNDKHFEAGLVSSRNAWERRSQSYFDSGKGVPRNATKPG